MWLLDGEPAPSDSTITRFMRGHLAEVIEDLFYQFVAKLCEIGEVKFRNLFVDGTKIEAYANKYTFVWKKGCGKGKISTFFSPLSDTYSRDNLHSTHRKPHTLCSVFLLCTHVHVSECRMRIHIFGVLIDDTAGIIEEIEDTCHDPRVVAILDLSNGGVCRLEVLILCHAKIPPLLRRLTQHFLQRRRNGCQARRNSISTVILR